MMLVLASKSPRRSVLLKQVGIPFRVESPGEQETVRDDLPPSKLVIELASSKAAAIMLKPGERFVLAADTIVVLNGRIMGKPKDHEEARRMLELLAGSVHQVFTGLVLLDTLTGKKEEGFSVTSVWMKKLSRNQIEAYLDTGEPYDKAGAYAIQGYAALMIDRIEGSYSNVVGLPLELIIELFARLNIPLWINGKDGINEG